MKSLLLCALSHFITLSTGSTPAIDSWGSLSAGISSNQMTSVVIPPAGFKCRVCEDVARTWRNTFQCVGMGENSLAPRYALSLYDRRSRFLSLFLFVPRAFPPSIVPSYHPSPSDFFLNGCCASNIFLPLFLPLSHPSSHNKEQRKMDRDAQQHPTATNSKAASKQLAKI